MTQQAPGVEMFDTLRGMVIGYLAAEAEGLGGTDAQLGDIALIHHDQELMDNFLVTALQVLTEAVEGWSGASGHDVPVLLDALRHPRQD